MLGSNCHLDWLTSGTVNTVMSDGENARHAVKVGPTSYNHTEELPTMTWDAITKNDPPVSSNIALCVADHAGMVLKSARPA